MGTVRISEGEDFIIEKHSRQENTPVVEVFKVNGRSGAVTVDGAPLGGGGALVPTSATITVGDVEGNHQLVTVQLKDQNGDNIAAVTPLMVWFSLSPGSYAIGGTLGSMYPTVGTLLYFFNSPVFATALTDANGVYVADVVDMVSVGAYFNIQAGAVVAQSEEALTQTSFGGGG